MSGFIPKVARFTVLVLLLLVGVGSDPSVMNSDESDDDTVVVAVEMEVAAPYDTIAVSEHFESRLDSLLAAPARRMVFVQGRSEHAPDTASAPLIVPLRT